MFREQPSFIMLHLPTLKIISLQGYESGAMALKLGPGEKWSTKVLKTGASTSYRSHSSGLSNYHSLIQLAGKTTIQSYFKVQLIKLGMRRFSTFFFLQHWPWTDLSKGFILRKLAAFLVMVDQEVVFDNS